MENCQTEPGSNLLSYCCVSGISVSSLSDGLFVLHVPSEDNKQKVRPKTSHKSFLRMFLIYFV